MKTTFCTHVHSLPRAMALPLLSSLALALAACGTPSPQAVGAQSLSRLKDKSLVVGMPAARPDFTAFTPGKAAFSFLGDVAMRSEGNRIVADNAIADPAVSIGRGLAQGLGAAAGVKPVAAAAPITSDDESPAAVSVKAAGAGLVLWVRTQDWRTWYYPSNFNRHRARVEVSAALIDVASKTVLAQATCDESSPTSADASPTYSEMVGAGARRLKEELAKAQSACVATLKRGLLGS
jgi:hypothetical protein